MKNKLDYNNGANELPPGAFRISASQFNKFMTEPHKWYRNVILKEDNFEGNTSSVIGTCVHYIAECFAKDIKVDLEEVERYIHKFDKIEDVDVDQVLREYKSLGVQLVNDYVRHNKPRHAEVFMTSEVQDGYFAGGEIDAIDNGMIIDYKTYRAKTKPKAIPQHYRYQLLIYAKVARDKGIPIDRIRLVYINRNIDGEISEKTGKQLKSYPPEVTVLTETITDEDMEFITSVLNLCIDTVKTSIEHPELTYVLFKDMRLKGE